MERDELLIRLRERIVAYAASQYSKEIAEDLAQEVFVVLQEKYDQVQELHDLVPLSLQILRFKMLDYRRKTFRRGESRQVPVEDLPLQSSTLHPDTLLERKQMANRILAAIQQLSPRCRLLFRMKLEGKTFSQILERLGVR
ncbi:MAG: RNA polymerase sigma factor, partial [Nitrospirales bacterium]